MLGWITRCRPGFSIIGLVLPLVCAFFDFLMSSLWSSFFPPSSSPVQGGLNIVQRAFVLYIVIHIHMLDFPLRLGWSIFRATGKGEIAGKSSNVAFAARRIVEIHRTDLNEDSCNVVVTVMDADTHLSRDYFTEIRRLHYAHLNEADRSLYCCPIIFGRNSHESPFLVRCADLLWRFAGLSTMYPGTMISIPTSVFSLPLSLAEKVGGLDSDPTAIGEDMHMLLKCYFETGGNVIPRVVYVPASQCNVSSDRDRGRDRDRGWRRLVI